MCFFSYRYTIFFIFFLASSPTFSGSDDLIQRGEYLVNFGGCHDCHSPKIITDRGPQPDPERLLSGYPAGTVLPELPTDVIGSGQWGAVATPDLTGWFGPWGVSFSINLTPHPETGLGNWMEDQFIRAMRTGQHLGSGRPILPPMPWFSLAVLSDEDLKAIFGYLGSIPAIDNRVPEPIPPAIN